jgi:hypothetical protein
VPSPSGFCHIVNLVFLFPLRSALCSSLFYFFFQAEQSVVRRRRREHTSHVGASQRLPLPFLPLHLSSSLPRTSPPASHSHPDRRRRNELRLRRQPCRLHSRPLRARRLRPRSGLGPLTGPLRRLRRQRDRMRRRGEWRRRRALPLGAGAAVPLLSVVRRRVADGAACVPGWAHRRGGGGRAVSGEEGQAEGSAGRVQHRPLSTKVRQRKHQCCGSGMFIPDPGS